MEYNRSKRYSDHYQYKENNQQDFNRPSQCNSFHTTPDLKIMPLNRAVVSTSESAVKIKAGKS